MTRAPTFLRRLWSGGWDLALRAALRWAPPDRALGRCLERVDRAFGQNDTSIERNGEGLFLRQLAALRPAGVVFDVGANVGHWAELAAEMAPGWTLHCFEPAAETFARLRARLESRPERFTLHALGLSDAAGTQTLHCFGDQHELGSLHARGAGLTPGTLVETSAVGVELDTLDGFCARERLERVTLVKIDTEGHECRVLAGARESLKAQRITALQFEYGGTWRDSRTYFLDAWSLLTEYGYAVFRITAGGLWPLARYEPRLENFQFANFAALAPECRWPEAAHAPGSPVA